MHFLNFKNKLKNFPIFSIMDIAKIDSSFHKQRLSEWQKKGYIRKIRQGFYIFSDLEISEGTLFIFANRIHQPSYISLEMALSVYGLIPEGVYEITSVTSNKTTRLQTVVGNFIYRHIKPELMFGYELKEYNGHYYKIAEIEKAILDFFYFHPDIDDEAGFDGMRFNVEEFKEHASIEKLHRYLLYYRNKALTHRINKFLTYMEYAQS